MSQERHEGNWQTVYHSQLVISRGKRVMKIRLINLAGFSGRWMLPEGQLEDRVQLPQLLRSSIQGHGQGGEEVNRRRGNRKEERGKRRRRRRRRRRGKREEGGGGRRRGLLVE